MKVELPTIEHHREPPADLNEFTLDDLLRLQRRLGVHVGTVAHAIELKLAGRTKPGRKAVMHAGT